MSSLYKPSDLDHTAALDPLQARIAQHTAEQEKSLGDLQGLVGAALAVPKEAVQPVFEALGKRHLSMLAEQHKLQLQQHLVTAVMKCIGGYLTQRRGFMYHICPGYWNIGPSPPNCPLPTTCC